MQEEVEMEKQAFAGAVQVYCTVRRHNSAQDS